MNKFIEFFGAAHLNSRNIAAYESEKGITLKAENVETSRVLGFVHFESIEAAENWFSNLPGINNISRLDSALALITGE